MRKSLLVSAMAVLLSAGAGIAQTAKKPVAASPKKSALDKATLEAYVRHLFVLDSRVQVEMGAPVASTELPGFSEVTVHASIGSQFQDFRFLVSKDGSKILQATVFDISQNPFKKDLDKLKTEFTPSFGTPGAPVVLVAFTDFQCPYCKEEANMLRQNLLTAYPTQVRFYLKEFPLESIHPWSKPAAIAGRCVFRQTPAAFWSYHDWVFNHQGEIAADTLKSKVLDWAKDQKELDVLQLSQCMDTKATESEVDKSIAEGQELGVNSTPTLFINGRRIAQAIGWPELRSIIDYEIEYQKTAKNAGEDCGCDTKLDLPAASKPPALPFGGARK